MNSKDYFKDIYKDFFGVESLPKIEVKEKEEMGSQEKMASLFQRINNLYISDESKDLLKKIIEYMRKYKEKIESNYIPFRITIIGNNTLIDDITDLLYNAGNYFDYINNIKNEISLYKLSNYEFENSGLLLLNGLNGLSLEDNKKQEEFIYDLKGFLNKDDKVITIVAGTKEAVYNFFLGRESIKNNYFDFEIEGINPDVQDIYNKVLDNVTIDEKMQIDLLDYITKTYNSDVDYILYQNDLISQ